jgi:hypothetical protein
MWLIISDMWLSYIVKNNKRDKKNFGKQSLMEEIDKYHMNYKKKHM